LAAEGHYSEAAEKLELALASCPWIRELSRIRTTLGYVQMKLGKGAESVRTLERDLRSLDESHQQLRLVLLGEAQATRGNSSVASILLGNMVSTKDQLLSTLRQRYLTSLQTSQPKVDDMPDRDEIRLLLAA
jgi:Tfp pilus assembly protein PilF